MRLLKLLIVVGAAYFGYQKWQEHRTASAIRSASSSHGFVALPPASGISTQGVTVIAAENCPHEAAQRADALATKLAGNGVPVVRSHSVNFTLNGADAGLADRITTVMNGELPIVFINGRARANPSYDDVMAEWRSTHAE